MKSSLRNRIAFYFMTATALLVAALFITLYSVVSNTVYKHLDGDLDTESEEVSKSLFISGSEIIFANPFEWTEREHGQVEVNPSFIQVMDINGNMLKKTKNLQNETLSFNPQLKELTYFNTTLSNKPVRQLQKPVLNDSGKTAGFLIISIPLEESSLVLGNLKLVLLISFPVVILILFLTTRIIAGKSIKPINKVIATADKITKENLDERIPLSGKKDEIHTLVTTINKLLDRLQDGILREKQFTSDASHELRTPLAVIKGTLEVLIRKPRDTYQYETKIKYAISEINRMSALIEQLLMLARHESGKVTPVPGITDLAKIWESVILRHQSNIFEKRIHINFFPGKVYEVKADAFMLEVVFENILTNALKYSAPGGTIDIEFKETPSNILCLIRDNGIGMTEEQINKIFDRFYRAESSRQSDIPGNGLGLSIVKRLSGLLNITLRYESKPSGGTTVYLTFDKKTSPFLQQTVSALHENILS